MPDAAQALVMLGGLPRILQAADATDRRTLLQSLFTSVVLEPHLATKAKARHEYGELLLKLDERVESTGWWAGWAPGTRSEVVVPPDLWQRIVAALEDAEDRALVQALHSRLTEGPAASGALRWQDVADQWQ